MHIFALLKLISLILSVWVLILSVQPVCAVQEEDRCCASDNLCNSRNDDKQEQDCEGVCNPFQSCTCCVFSVMLPLRLPNVLFIEFEEKASFIGKPTLDFAEDPTYTFWHPPRL